MTDHQQATHHPLSGDMQRCPACNYRVIPRQGLLIHEAAALFAVILYGCDDPANHPSLLRVRTTGVLNDHTNNAGLCPVCDCQWPCPTAICAQPRLATLSPRPPLGSGR